MSPLHFFYYLLAFAGGTGVFGLVLLFLYLLLLFIRGLLVKVN